MSRGRLLTVQGVMRDEQRKTPNNQKKDKRDEIFNEDNKSHGDGRKS